MPDHDVSPVLPLSAREAGVAEPTLYEGVPLHLDGPLRAWAREFLHPALAQRVALRLRIALQPAAPPMARRPRSQLREALDAAHGWDDPGPDQPVPASPRHLIDDLPGPQLLDAMDLGLQLDHQLASELDEAAMAAGAGQPISWEMERLDAALALRKLLDDAGSVYTLPLNMSWPAATAMLLRRVDATVTAAAEMATATASPTAAQRLRDAWRLAYGLHPDATGAYREAVRAAEEIACPLVLDKAAANNSASLGTVRNHLRGAPDKWQFVLLDKDGDGSVEPLVAMLDRLWTGQVSRHGGGSRSRDQTQAEAEAAVHLAATLVQLLATGALARRSTP